MAELKIGYGVILPTIHEQVMQQGFRVVSVSMAIRHEEFRKAINKLRLSQIMTESESDRAFARLHKRVTTNVEAKE